MTTATEWNYMFEEERMGHVLTKTSTRVIDEEVWRTVQGTSYTEQVSNQGRLRKTSLAKILAGKEGSDVLSPDRAYVDKVMNEAFPLMGEKLFN